MITFLKKWHAAFTEDKIQRGLDQTRSATNLMSDKDKDSGNLISDEKPECEPLLGDFNGIEHTFETEWYNNN